MHVEPPVAAVMTQTLRLNACIEFVNTMGDNSTVTVFTGDPGAFDGVDLPRDVSVTSVNPRELFLTDPVRIGRVGRRRLLGWMRSGSKIGRLVEKAARRLIRIVRPLGDPGGQEIGVVANQPTNSYLIEELESLHGEHPLSTIVVFDVFDLPSVMQFASRAGVHVIVR